MNQKQQCQQWITRLKAGAQRLGRAVAFMEVCGTHTVSACRTGLHSVMPDTVRLVSGPGCPVCVTSQGDIDLLVEVVLKHGVTMCTYGDMVRVPGQHGSLEWARAQGAQVRVIYSAMDAVKFAEANPGTQVVFAAVGFETTTPATAAAILAADRKSLTNFTVLASHKTVIPAMRALLDTGNVKLDGFLCPGHVSVIIGAEAYEPIAGPYKMPCVIGGFEDWQMAEALAALVEQVERGEARVENLYPEVVSGKGNRVAQTLIEQVFEPIDVPWRALGVIPGSGLGIRKRYALYDAMVRYNLVAHEAPEPKGCRCGEVITGRCGPQDCRLFGTACTPIDPIGPCMVSSEGSCAAHFKYKRHRRPDSQAGSNPVGAPGLRAGSQGGAS